MLLIGAGLLIRSFVRLQAVPPGFNAEHVISMRIAATGPEIPDDKAVAGLLPRHRRPHRHVPGVQSEGRVSALPLTGDRSAGEESTSKDSRRRPARSCRWTCASRRRTTSARWRSRSRRAGSSPITTRRTASMWPSSTSSSRNASGRTSDPIGKHVWFDPKKPIDDRRGGG